MKFTNEDIELLDKLNNTGTVESNIYVTAQHGYIRNLDRIDLKALEQMFRRVFDQSKFVLCYYCPSDVMKIVLVIYREFEKQKAEMATGANEILNMIMNLEPPKDEYEKVGNVIRKKEDKKK